MFRLDQEMGSRHRCLYFYTSLFMEVNSLNRTVNRRDSNQEIRHFIHIYNGWNVIKTFLIVLPYTLPFWFVGIYKESVKYCLIKTVSSFLTTFTLKFKRLVVNGESVSRNESPQSRKQRKN